jgi:replicative DNA helicase
MDEGKIEQNVIGSLILKPEYYTEVAEIISIKDFKIDLYRHAFQTISNMKEKGSDVELSALYLEMGRPDKASILSESLDSSFLSPTYYANLLRRRNLEDEIKRTAGEREFENTKERIKEIESLGKPSTLYNIQKMIEEKDDFNEYFQTGFVDLDHYVKLRPGNVMILAGRPSIGKSSFGLSILGHLAQSTPVGLISFEMSKRAIGERLVSMYSLDYLNQINNNFIGVSPSAFNVHEVRKALVEIVDKRQGKIIMIDYLQLMQEIRRYESRRVEVTKLSRGIKELAKEFNVAIILISSLSRELGAEDSRPSMNLLKESGDIEYDADIVVILHKPKKPKEGEAKYQALLEKNRMGKAKKIINLVWIENKVCFGTWQANEEMSLPYKEN